MCTALTYKTKGTYFGRNLDYEFSYGEQIVVTPRNYVFNLRHSDPIPTHYAMIGVALVQDNYPLYFDGMNEKGLCIAGLNFVGNAYYKESLSESKTNITLSEFIPYILGKHTTIEEVKESLEKIELVNTFFKDSLPNSPLHWLITDKDNHSITVEFMKDGLHVYDNPVGVLTNNPPFPVQLFNLNNYQHLSEKQPSNTFAPDVNLSNYSRGMGGLGLPGDLSSMSRFVRASFTKSHALSKDDEASSVSQFFHLLNSVDQQRGCCEVSEGKYEITLYSSCMSCDTGIYYYTTYDRHQISAVNMNHVDLDGTSISCYPMLQEDTIHFEN